jgi:hypothetical protein
MCIWFVEFSARATISQTAFSGLERQCVSRDVETGSSKAIYVVDEFYA